MTTDQKRNAAEIIRLVADGLVGGEPESRIEEELVKLLDKQKLQQAPCSSQLPPDGFVQSFNNVREWLAKSDMHPDDYNTCRLALNTIIAAIPHPNLRRQLR